MKTKKINLEELGQSLSRSEMKEVMAGSGYYGGGEPGCGRTHLPDCPYTHPCIDIHTDKEPPERYTCSRCCVED